MEASTLTAAKRYEELSTERLPYLQRARQCSTVTLPMLYPAEGETASRTFKTPYQSIGASGVTHLAAKLLLALFPSNTPFFRLNPNQEICSQLSDQDMAAFRTAFAQIENTVMTDLESRGFRVYANEMFNHLIVAGNVLLFVGPDTTRVYPLTSFVVKRDPAGNVLEVLVKETVAPTALPADFLDKLKKSPDFPKSNEKTLDIFTWIKREDSKWTIHQEVKGEIVPKSNGTYPLDKCPWIPLRFRRVDGESYGRSYCEEFIGDLLSLEKLSEAIVMGSAACARVLFLVNPAGMTDSEDITGAANLSAIPGQKDDVTTLTVDKFPDFKVALETLEKIEQRLSGAFLLQSAIRRDAERVTAEEIRYMATELEDALGGLYSVLSQELQRPLVNVLMTQLQKASKLPDLPKGTVDVLIVTGLDALGRNHEIMRLDAALAGLLQQPQVAAMINWGDYLNRRLLAYGIDPKGLIKSDQQMQAEQQAAMQQQMAQKLGPAGIKAASDQAIDMRNQQTQMMQGQMNG